VVEWLRTLAVSLAIVLIVRLFVFDPIRVDGPSMEDTLFTDEIMFVSKLNYRFGLPSRGDVVVCHFPNSKFNYVKRIVGLPGELVAVLEDGTVTIDGTPLQEDYIAHKAVRPMEPLLVGDDSYLVMGDNRPNSRDSRDPSIGPIPKNQLVGKAMAVIWPLNQMSVIRH
jgi:signal peptidase I